MVRLTEEMREALSQAFSDRRFCVLATASREGWPDVSYRGSVVVLDAEHLAFWERSRGTALDNMTENPRVCIMYSNPEQRKFWRFYGQAELIREGAERERIMRLIPQPELDRDPERRGVAVRVRLETVREGPAVIMRREESRP
ncbi:MAG: pyridoxamine 5'-phosphate oxidase family protein [Firmicutes bacterium]|nr:pyridoxamine 5'-phosphate oxidase family protein [Alicyclobacillaceae bacterium]MCL6496187.1 pyridoxamine 5'-phosphate oxidase family protein [Bacillota bacterium]